MKSLMIDIETLGTSPTAGVLSVGVVAFNLDLGVVESQGWAIRPQDWHGEINPNTLHWWANQSPEAREYSWTGKLSAAAVAQHIATFIAGYGGVDEVWANDPDFDVVILKSWWARVGATRLGRFPFEYNKCRSFRTITAEARRLGIDYSHLYGGTAHNPVDDAAGQARVVNFIRTRITAR